MLFACLTVFHLHWQLCAALTGLSYSLCCLLQPKLNGPMISKTDSNLHLQHQVSGPTGQLQVMPPDLCHPCIDAQGRRASARRSQLYPRLDSLLCFTWLVQSADVSSIILSCTRSVSCKVMLSLAPLHSPSKLCLSWKLQACFS